MLFIFESWRIYGCSYSTTDPIFAPNEAYLASGAASTCRASPRPRCKLDLADDFVDAIELSPVTPVEKQNDDLVLSCAQSQVKRKTQQTREMIQFAALCWFVYLEGWNDGSNGPLLPRIQKVYGVGYAVVSLIFVFACLGFVMGAVSNVILAEKLGFGKVMVLGSLLQVLAYCIESSGPPFPVFIFAFFMNGIGLALQNANSVGYVASLKENTAVKMSLFMAVYGAGALSSPLVATQFSHLPQWNLHYLTSLGIAITNTIALITVFRLKPQRECLAEIGIVDVDNGTSEHSHLRQIVANKDVHLLAAFALLYVGAEVTIGGWSVTYVIGVRGGGPSSGYISTGFFGGLMAGRVVLLWCNEKIGERLALFIYAVLAIILELVVWFVPSLVGDAVAVSVIGVLLGPMYPIAMNHAGRVLPRWLLTGAIGWVAGVGQAGSALVPFMTGAIAQNSGIKTLQPVLVGILCLMTVLWALVSRGSRRPD
ncbi:MFS general substrate transporter [Suillus clintonianus]|uniref:MFS general substrate transporter n=1 Tax=Suillus clintonianus TaxID=1904413 RepID=UPI001B8811D5|nr:MFS general substrate transporter [Suillus clintonianus]KAG2124449.1 MFS general substrate transporter [Suillus clintonianus]